MSGHVAYGLRWLSLDGTWS